MEIIREVIAENSDLRFPIGKFDASVEVTEELRRNYRETIANLPVDLSKAVKNLSDAQLDTEYRPEGWTVRQTVHHIADSHLNAYTRFKLALTEDVPTIRPYAEDRWAELEDSRMPLEVSLKIIEGIHARWTHLLNSMGDQHFGRKLIHPDSGEWTLDKMLGMYDWHSRHHTAHITHLRARNSW